MNDDRDIEQLMAEFRKSVDATVREDDTATHFDLAVAYAEMGLWRDAHAELELVLQHEPWHARARAALPLIEAQLGKSPSGPIGDA